jgi:Protein of unknown function (DUF1572)
MPANSPILTACRDEFSKTRRLAEGALSQLEDPHFHTRINPHQNSIAQIIQHLHGNMLSRWTDFLTTDGEKPTRDREGEFALRPLSRGEVMSLWQDGWQCLELALAPLTDADLTGTVFIRKEPHTVFQAINRQTAHYSQHIGQILLIAKHLLGDRWVYLTIPPGGTAAFNRSKGL